MEVKYFREAGEFRQWLEENHISRTEQWLGFLKKQKSLKPAFTYTEAVETALCYGWIDGLTQSVDEKSFKVRFTPRKPGSNWSRINLQRVEALLSAGLMHKSGIEIYEKRKAEFRNIMPENAEVFKLPAKYEELLQKNHTAWNYWLNATPSYRRTWARWVNSAKQESTRLKRLDKLIECCDNGLKIPLVGTK